MSKKKKLYKRNGKEVLVLKTVNAGMTSHYGNAFKYPKRGWVEAHDWEESSNGRRGAGLHGILWGETTAPLLLNWEPNAVWLVIKVIVSDGLDLQPTKCRFRRGYVLHAGTRNSATAYLASRVSFVPVIIGASTTAGYNGQATAGYNGQATAGYNGQATAGYNGQATAGYNGQATAGNNGQATAGDNGQATAGDNGQATAGYNGQATAGDNGRATAGN